MKWEKFKDQTIINICCMVTKIVKRILAQSVATIVDRAILTV